MERAQTAASRWTCVLWANENGASYSYYRRMQTETDKQEIITIHLWGIERNGQFLLIVKAKNSVTHGTHHKILAIECMWSTSSGGRMPRKCGRPGQTILPEMVRCWGQNKTLKSRGWKWGNEVAKEKVVSLPKNEINVRCLDISFYRIFINV